MAPREINVLPRSEIAPKYTWNAPSVFTSDEAWEKEMQVIGDYVFEYRQYRGSLGTSPAALAEALEQMDAVRDRTEKVLIYAGISYYVDTENQHAAAMFGRANALFSHVGATLAFVEPEILAIGAETVRQWVKLEPRLSVYEHYFDNVFRKQVHIRSADVEELLGRLGDPFGNVALTGSMLTDADFQFPSAIDDDGQGIPVTQGTIETILRGSDREARRTAWENYRDQHLAYENTLASNLITSMKQSVFFMHARHHESTLDAALFEMNIPAEVYFNLIETFRRNLPTWHRYWDIRRRALGVETLHPYDIWAPLTNHGPTIDFEQGVEWICEALKPLGDDYVENMRHGCLHDRWIDLYPNQGKTSGAFSWGSKITQPFIVMSYDNTLYSLSTLAHELGHSMHSYLTWQNQPSTYSDYSLFAGEVASNFNQAMLRSYLLETISDQNFQINLIEEAMYNFHRYFLIMPTLARFELETHQRLERGEALNADIMNKLTAEFFAEAYGESMYIDQDRMGITWSTFSHLYTDYYVFQYATGISGAHALANQIRSGKDPSHYLSFLKAGSSLYPLDALKMAGVDLSSPEPIDQAFASLAAMVDQLETLL